MVVTGRWELIASGVSRGGCDFERTAFDELPREEVGNRGIGLLRSGVGVGDK